MVLQRGKITVRGNRFITNSAFDYMTFHGKEDKRARLIWKEKDNE